MTKRKTSILLLGFLIIIIGSIAACVHMYYKGFMRSEVVVQPPQVTPFAAWGVIVCIILWIVFLILWCVLAAMGYNGEITQAGRVFALYGTFALCLVALTGVALQSHAKVYLQTERIPYFKDLSLEELGGLADSGFTGVVYIERESCVLCAKARPEIEEFLEKRYKSMSYYDTAQDREQSYDKMMEIIARYGVTEVPSIVILEDGDVEALYTYRAIMSGTAFKDILKR